MDNSDILIYQNPDGNIKIDVRNVFKEDKLDEGVVVRNFRSPAQNNFCI